MMSLAAYLFLLGICGLQQISVSAQTLEASLCEKTTSANASDVPFSYSNNAWGNITGQASGYQCLNIYDDGSTWTATYQWSGEPTLVKAYPRMRAWPSNMPLQLNTLTQLLVNVNFKTYTTEGGENDAAYQSAGLVANVAMDLFVAPTADGATQVSPPIEIMVWPWWTPTILPLGYTSSTPDKDTLQVNGATWSLYHGLNEGGQNVFSWLAHDNVTSLNGDYAPLISYLVDNNYISGDMWASQLQLGQEMKLALKETNFHVEASELRVVRADEASSAAPPASSTVVQTSALSVPVSSVPAPASTSADSTMSLTTTQHIVTPVIPIAESPTTVSTSYSFSPVTVSSVSASSTVAVTSGPFGVPSSSLSLTTTSTVARISSITTASHSQAPTSVQAATTTTSNAAVQNSHNNNPWFALIITFIAGLL